MLDAPRSSKATRKKHEPDKKKLIGSRCAEIVYRFVRVSWTRVFTPAATAQAVENQIESLIMTLPNL